MDWLPGVMALIGVVIGLGYTELRNRRERKERLPLMTFEKRLEAHQKAYYWWNKLNEVLNIGERDEIHRISREAREWWNSSCLFLDTNSRRQMVRLMNYSHMYANGNEYAQAHIWDYVIETSKAILSGIEAEYLPEALEKPEEAKN